MEKNALGTRLKLEEHDKTLIFRFTIPESKVADSKFTLWGQGLVGEGVTFEIRLADFPPPAKN